jgi:hypothetical protein
VDNPRHIIAGRKRRENIRTDDGCPLFGISETGRHLSQKTRFVGNVDQQALSISDDVVLQSVVDVEYASGAHHGSGSQFPVKVDEMSINDDNIINVDCPCVGDAPESRVH